MNPDPVDAVARTPMPTASPTSSWSLWSATRTARIADNDSVIFFNFRPDRAREITRAIVDPDFDGFQRDSSSP